LSDSSSGHFIQLRTYVRQDGGLVSSSEKKAPCISDLTRVNSEFKSICCQHLQQELETALLELKTTKQIIELLK
jgi:hypothetical protein